MTDLPLIQDIVSPTLSVIRNIFFAHALAQMSSVITDNLNRISNDSNRGELV